MAQKKTVTVDNREIVVETLSFAGMMELAGEKLTVINVLKKCVKESDWNYLEELDFDNSEESGKWMNDLLQACIEVNPALFNKDRFLRDKKTESTTSGQQAISDGPPDN